MNYFKHPSAIIDDAAQISERLDPLLKGEAECFCAHSKQKYILKENRVTVEQ